MWKYLVFFIFLSLESNFAEDCGSFVVDDCHRNLCENRAVNNIASPALCQILCTLTVDFTCQSFAYSRGHEICDLYACPMSKWLENCNEFGGPSSPSLDECLGIDNGCGGFKEAICDFDQSNIIANFEDLLGPADCQIFCDATPDCEFFYHDRQYCTFYSKRSGHCDVISGPFDPNYGTCQEEPSGTTTTRPTPPGDEMIKLSWELELIDLDLHLVLFNGLDKECEIYYNNQVCDGAVLNSDHTEGGNIESITFSSLEAGIDYMVYVFDFKHWDPNRPMSSSNANVLISAPGIDAVEVQVPIDLESEHRYWLVGCFNGQDGLGNFNVKNQLLDVNPNYNPHLCD